MLRRVKVDAIKMKIGTRNGDKTILCRQVVWLSLGKRPEGGAETKSSGLRGQEMGGEGR